MPLHLLTKKSWNVYAPQNIERVKRDEAEAQHKAIEQEKRRLQDEADDRLEILKQHNNGDKKGLKRKLPGEDDTDRDIRLALKSASSPTRRKEQDTRSVVDPDGHVSLITSPQKRPRVEKEPEKDPYTVYLTDATGERGQQSKDTWYTSIRPEREKYGDDNPRKQARELARMNSNDPLAAMKKGVRVLKDNERARKEWMAQRERDLEEIEQLAKKKRPRRKRSRGDGELESLEGFNLDDDEYSEEASSKRHHDADSSRETRHRHRHHHHQHRNRHERRSRNHHPPNEDDGRLARNESNKAKDPAT